MGSFAIQVCFTICLSMLQHLKTKSGIDTEIQHLLTQMLAAAEQREKENAMRGVKTQKAAGKLKAEMTSRNQPHASSNKPDLAKDWL